MTRSPSIRTGRLAAVLALASLALSAGANAEQKTAAAPISASWQQHKFSFQYLGFTSTYSCDGLADKLRRLLLAAGARPDVKSEPGACAAPFGRPDKFARADLTFYTLVPTPPGPSTVPGVWRNVSFAQYTPQELRLGDCELVEQFRTQVLKMFTTQNVVDHTTCIPHQESGSVIDLRFEALALPPAPSPGSVAAPPPGAPPPGAPRAP